MALYVEPVVDEDRASYSGSKFAAWVAFGLTFLLMLSDYIDRQIVVSILPILKAQWRLSDTQLGGVISIVSLTVGLFSIPVAFLSDRWSRVKSIVVMALVWSLATVGCAYATDYTHLLVMRGLVGVGEAGYGAVGAALLAGLFPSHMRARILAAFAAAAAIGAVLGVLLGGIIAKTWGWQAAFGAVGVPGLGLALLYLLVRDPADDAKRSGRDAKVRLGFGATAKALLATPSVFAVYLGYAIQLFVVSTVFSWLPSYLNRAYGLPVDQAAIRAAIVLIVSSLAAIAWGWLADRVSRQRPRNKIWVMATSSFASAVVLTLAFGMLPPGPAQFAMIAVGGALMTGSLGSVGALAFDVSHPGIRATTIAVGALIGNLFGLSAGPFISGMLSDAYGLSTALAIVPAFGVLASIVMVATFGLYDRDMAKLGMPRDAVLKVG